MHSKLIQNERLKNGNNKFTLGCNFSISLSSLEEICSTKLATQFTKCFQSLKLKKLK